MLVSFHLTACFSLRSTPEELLDSVLDAAETSGVSRYPYLASLRAMSPGTGTSRHICGGALVGPSHVLVPASCLVDKVVFNPEVHLGRAYSIASDMQTNVEHAEIIPGEQVHFHPDWTIGASLANFSSAAPDLAVVQLQRPSKYAPVKMPDTEFVVSQHPRLRTMGWAPSGRGEGEHFMDVSVADLLADRPTQLNSARDLYWASQKMPPSWCGFEAGRALVIRAAAGHPQDEDILAGIQSEETESVCWNSREASSPRPVAFTPVGSSAGNTGWVTALINAHSAGQTLTGFKQPLGASEELNCGSGEVYSTEFQSLQVCGW
eukprot:CAMPEP_0117647980 /NCGR_PEP_ID=MMETSP0804-20121206/140_1 /TAXON_ID=1074897 /ORGANISM="Tetraselmis astigmatica, Strain CCMP880" /LENGTH=319 /DNA_ID=CAMNT_0005453511 /DNA_START=415 /DNA_END=1374 /DNA_ORIENTATION=+